MLQYKKYLWLAKELYNDSKYNQEEITLRTIINRCYYAAVLHARELVSQTIESMDTLLFKQYEDKILKRGAIHSFVRRIVKLIDPLLGHILSRLAELRRKSDYELYDTITRNETNEAIALATSIIESIDNIQKSTIILETNLVEQIISKYSNLQFFIPFFSTLSIAIDLAIVIIFGIVLFFDLQLIRQYPEDWANHALSIFLDLLNIILRILIVLIKIYAESQQ